MATETFEDDLPTISIDAALSLLANPRRRAVIDLVREYERTNIRELSTRIAAREHDIEESQVTGSQRQSAHVTLYEAHLGKLDDAHVIEYDKRVGSVTRGPTFDVAVECLDVIRDTVRNGGE